MGEADILARGTERKKQRGNKFEGSHTVAFLLK